MRKLVAAFVMSLVVCQSYAAEGEFEPDSHFSNGDQARELLAEGVKEFRTGRAADAAARFRDALKLNPENQLLYEFYLAVGDRLFMDMQEKDQLEDVLKEIRSGAYRYQWTLRHTPKYIGRLMDKLEKSEEERLVATNELVAVGPIAVPHLIARMNDNRQDDMRVYCRVVLTKMGYRAVVPLCEALNAKDERLVASVATVLADIGDARALPKLRQLGEDGASTDTVKRVVGNAIAAIAKASGQTAKSLPKEDKSAKKGDKKAESTAAIEQPAEVSTGDKLYFLEASRYFRGADSVRDEMIANESLMWKWNEDAADDAAKLGYVKVPRYAWNELMAEELLFDGAGYYPAYTGYQPLLAATLAAQDVEANHRVRIAKERTTPTQNPDESMDAVAERVQALAEMNLRVRMFGPEHLYRAVQQAIVSERYDVAVYVMRLMQDEYLADADRLLPSAEEGLTSEKAGTVLCAALDHGDKTVRYQAATTLAHLDPTLNFFNAEKVVPILSEAVGEWGMRVVVVVDQDYRQRNSARAQLQAQGYMVFAANNGFDLMQRLEETPVKDAIIIAGDLLPDLRDEYGGPIDVPEQKVFLDAAGKPIDEKNPKSPKAMPLLEALSKDWRTEHTPVFISLPENPELAAKIQAAFEGKVAGFIKKPFSGTEMEGLIEQSLKDAQLPNVNREDAEDVSLRAAIALGAADPARTQFDLSQAGAALVGTLDKRSDDLRVQTLNALGHAAQCHINGDAVKAMIAKVTDVYGAQDATLTPAVRCAFLYAIGQLDPSTEASVAILKAALKSDDASVRAAAANAVGHAPAIANDASYNYQLQQRLDARAAGAGKDAAAAAKE